jgi:GNAT superfamily N-acetyltransferase
VARIETTIVDEKMRGKGIGTALLKKCEEKAREKGYKLVEVDSGFQRDDAHKFYEHNGYAKRGYLFWKNL